MVLHLNVEEVVDAAWRTDHSLLPALSGKGNSPVPEEGGQREAYRHAYEAYVDRFTTTLTRLARAETPQRDVVVEAGDVLRPQLEEPLSSFSDRLFDAALEQTPLPTWADIDPSEGA